MSSHYDYTPTGDSWPYFVPGDGIAHQVIQTDICRYLGNDARVKRGTERSTGIEGYYYFGYRSLTSAMIRTLKEDSARWQAERSEFRHRYHKVGPDYHRSATYQDSRRRETSGGYTQASHVSASMPVQSLPTAAPEAGPRYLYTQDGMPYWDNYRQQYLPVASSTAQPEDTVPRSSQPAPANPYQQATGTHHQPVPKPAPLDPATNQPMAGYWGVGAHGQEVFYTYASQ